MCQLSQRQQRTWNGAHLTGAAAASSEPRLRPWSSALPPAGWTTKHWSWVKMRDQKALLARSFSGEGGLFQGLLPPWGNCSSHGLPCLAVDRPEARGTSCLAAPSLSFLSGEGLCPCLPPSCSVNSRMTHKFLVPQQGAIVTGHLLWPASPHGALPLCKPQCTFPVGERDGEAVAPLLSRAGQGTSSWGPQGHTPLTPSSALHSQGSRCGVLQSHQPRQMIRGSRPSLVGLE